MDAQKNNPATVSKRMLRGDTEKLTKNDPGTPNSVANINQYLPARA
jgi:hypothetical protein